MNELLKTVLFQSLGYFLATIFSFVLFGFWQRGYFFAYLRVRTSLGKLILIKLVGPTKIIYKVGRIEEGNLLWGKIGKNGHILNDIRRDYIYMEQNVSCVDIDSLSYAFIPKEVHYAQVLNIPKDKKGEVIAPEQYVKIFNKRGNEVILRGIEGFDPEKVDSLVQRAQFKPSQIHNTVKFILLICTIILIISSVCLVNVFVTSDKVIKSDNHVGSVESKVDKILDYINTPKDIKGKIVKTGE